MEAEQMALKFFLTTPINAKTLSLRQKSTVVAKCPLDAPPHNEWIEFLCSENYLDQDFLVLFSWEYEVDLSSFSHFNLILISGV